MSSSLGLVDPSATTASHKSAIAKPHYRTSFGDRLIGMVVDNSLRIYHECMGKNEFADLTDFLEHTPSISVLMIMYSPSSSYIDGEQVAALLGKNKTLTSLYLIGVNLSGVASLAQGLRENTTLKYLHLAKSHIDAQERGDIGLLIEGNALIDLRITETKINDIGLEALSTKANTTLQFLDLQEWGGSTIPTNTDTRITRLLQNTALKTFSSNAGWNELRFGEPVPRS